MTADGALSHYDVLQVAPGSSHAEIRAAYHEAARRWHPDRFAGRPAKEAKRADDSMRRVNEAWRVLGDSERRTAYDAEKSGGSRGDNPYIRTTDGITRVDPRLVDPEVLARRRLAQEEASEAEHSSVIRVIPVLAFFGLLGAIFVFTAYANARGDGTNTTVPGPDIGVDAGACVRILPGPQLLEVPCTGTIDGRVVGAYAGASSCPAIAVRELELKPGLTVCLGP